MTNAHVAKHLRELETQISLGRCGAFSIREALLDLAEYLEAEPNPEMAKILEEKK
jgi:hypothetical protein